MRRTYAGRLITAGATALLLALGSTSASATLPPCENPEFCEWDFECFYTGPDSNVVPSCRLIKRCYC